MNAAEAPLPLLLLLVVCQTAATFTMVGLIWFVQRVHYPLFAAVGEERFAAYERAHVSRTNPVVGVPMLVEAGTALALVVQPPAGVSPLLPWLGLALLAAIRRSASSRRNALIRACGRNRHPCGGSCGFGFRKPDDPILSP